MFLHIFSYISAQFEKTFTLAPCAQKTGARVIGILLFIKVLFIHFSV